MENPSVIEIGDNDSIIITKQGKVVGFIDVKSNTQDRVEMVANPVTSYNFYREWNIFNSFATTMATNVKSVEDIESADNFIKFMKNKVKASV
jgi:hypothetical protein